MIKKQCLLRHAWVDECWLNDPMIGILKPRWSVARFRNGDEGRGIVSLKKIKIFQQIEKEPRNSSFSQWSSIFFMPHPPKINIWGSGTHCWLLSFSRPELLTPTPVAIHGHPHSPNLPLSLVSSQQSGSSLSRAGHRNCEARLKEEAVQKYI